jgi:hypothetical protein
MPSGGKRVDAGRPSGQGPYGEKTKTIRVPESAVTDIKTYLELRQQRVSLSLVPLSKMIRKATRATQYRRPTDGVYSN